jgi:tetratricopeptide (TPR) repeat protein
MNQAPVSEERSVEGLLTAACDDFLERLSRGEQPSVEDYARRYPAIAEIIRQMFPTLQLLRGSSASAGRSGEGRTEESSLAGCLGDYRILREVGRGGMGVVYEAEQISLARRVALKVLPFASTLDARQLQRFKNEAQAAARLHHAHIVPVYATGCERGVHFYAMPYIEGQTLAALIAELRQRAGRAPTPEEGPPTHAGNADPQRTGPYHPEAAQTRAGDTTLPPAKAHSGELSIRSAGFFRTVAELGIQATEALDHAHQLGVVHRDIKPGNLLVEGAPGVSTPGVRLWVSDFGLAHVQSQAGLTMTGDLVGTLRYMSPEQALAKRVVVDHRTDIYSLGVTLYELLTLEPAFGGRDHQELLRQIAFEEPKPPRRLNRAVPPELETIVLKAMEKNPADRYAMAQELADDLERFLKDEPIRARRPTLLQRARKWSRRHRPLVWSAAVVLLLAALMAGINGLWLAQKQAETRGAVEAVLKEANTLQDKGKWPEALAVAQRAEALLQLGGGRNALRQQLQDLLRDLEMVRRLEQARLSMTALREERFDLEAADEAYAEAFLAYGLDMDQLDPQESGKQMQARSIHLELAAALDLWASVRVATNRGDWRRLVTAARAADPDDWRNRFRDVLETRDAKDLERIIGSAPVGEWPATTMHLLSRLDRLLVSPRGKRVLAVLRQAQQRYPNDFWLNHELAVHLSDAQPEEALRFHTAAVAIRPQSPGAHLNLGSALYRKGRLDEAIAEYREALHLNTNYATAHLSLGWALAEKGQLDEAIAEHLVALRIKPDAETHNNLSVVLRRKGRLDDAIVESRKALSLEKDSFVLHINLGLALDEKGKPDEAIAEFREALRIKKDLPKAHGGLALALYHKGQLDEAIAEYRQALRLNKEDAMTHSNLGTALRDKGQLDEAIAEYREAIRLKQDYPEPHSNLGDALRDKGRLDEAIAECREAIRLKNDYPEAHDNLGNALQAKGQVEEAIAAYKEAIRLKKDLPKAHYNLGLALYAKGRQDEGIAEWREAIRIKKDFAEAHNNLGLALHDKGQLDEAIAEYQEAIRFKKDYSDARCNLGSALANKGRLDEAIAQWREAIRLGADNAEAHYNLAIALNARGRQAEAITQWREVIRLRKDDAAVHCNLGQALQQQGRFTEALAALRRGHELGSRQPNWPYPSAQWVRQAEQLVALDTKLSRVLQGEAQPADPSECLGLALLCRMHKKRFTAAARFYGAAFAMQPKLAEDMQEGHRYNAACVAALAGSGQGEDAAKLDGAERSRLRQQALGWLRADLEASGKLLEKERDKSRPRVIEQLRHWLANPDLAGVHSEEALAKLPEAERAVWQKFWASVADMRARAEEKAAPKEKSDRK